MPPPAGRRRTAARLAAVQALYQMDLTGAAPEIVIRDVLQAERAQPAGEKGGLPAPDPSTVSRLVSGVAENLELLDRHLATALSGDLVLDRLEVLLRAILRAGAYELLLRPDIPLKVIINEYLDLAHAFFAEREPPLVNAVLDRLAAARRPDDEPPSKAVNGA
ncbi:N utilization substance protein B homolog [Candidatus Defluviicoccus seviourii]|uniref:Transcription antitermination protein NusB n=1 Tax=Candidatus Defluviicoccus seviourii TaxID=2565273 RepID=A0A564WAS0_9PROT|nr:N utilization substance protein B homolog [Candidatus Defluviicoccus seviourii]